MATASMSADPSRMSFAKVAASAGTDNTAGAPFTKDGESTTSRAAREERQGPQANEKPPKTSSGGPISTSNKDSAAINGASHPSHHHTVKPENQRPSASSASPSNNADLVDAVKSLNVNDPTPSLVVNGTGATENSSKPDLAEGFSEDPFQRTDSGSELDTKPPSLDGKSITSGTTFALDEKESLRPDDSASVKAAEDDDTFSGRGSIVAGSRIGSEAAARGYRSQYYEASDRRGMQSTTQERQGQGINTPPSGSSEQQTTEDSKPKPLVGTTGTPDSFNLFYRQTPDEKLLEALESPKDRIFLLRLEQDVIEFVKDSKEPFTDLPPCNSFCRMLTHKLADYYHMTHQVDAVAGAVRIFRTPFCRLPPPLTSISNPPTSGNTPPPTMPAMKIMRRGGDGDTGPNTSKATSETGSDSKDKPLSAKEKLSREEREAAYNKARERIFGKDEKTGDATPDTEDGNEMSRSSSVSTKDRTGQGKKAKPVKQRREDSDNFDVRSQYTPFFPQQAPTGPTWAPAPQYAPMAPQQFNGVVQNGYQAMPQQFGPQNQSFNPGLMNNGNMQAYTNIPPQYPQPNQARFQPPMQTYGTPIQSPPLASQPWQQQNMFHSPYQQSRGPIGGGAQNTIPYAFGQLPSTANPADPKSQHPIPGSFNRHAFNPKTQSFVPGGAGMPVPQAMSHQGSPHLPYNAYTPPQQQASNGMGYNMARQGSNNSLPSYHASPHMANRPPIHQGMSHGMPSMPHGIQQNMNQGLSQGPHTAHNMQNMQGMQQNGQAGNHLPNYGNPATLPPKPPPGV